MGIPSYKNLVDLIDECRDRFGDFARFIHGGETWSFDAVDRRARALSRAWLDLGLRRGDRVAIVLPMCPEVQVCFPSLWRIGAVAVPIHFNYSAREIANIVRLCECKVIVTRSSMAEALAESSYRVGERSSPSAETIP